jgi:succinoglycan biosynthesis protein ExoO
MIRPRVLFVTREPIVHQLGGSTTYAANLMQLLQRAGADVTVVTTNAYCRSPRPWFRMCAMLPAGVDYRAPGMVRIGAWYLRPWSVRGWARFLLRLQFRMPAFKPLAALVQRCYGTRLVAEAWDLTPPTDAELRVATEFLREENPAVLVLNYAFWAPLLADSAAASRRSVILMHDILSARVARFVEQGLPLDCTFVDEATEMRWLDQADCLLAAQAREAEQIAPRVHGKVIVPPMVFSSHNVAGKVSEMPDRCLFVGSNIAPNKDGLAWFLREVWPAVRAANANATLAVAGSVCASVTSPPAGVALLGMVPSVDAEYARAAVCVVPLLVGSGIKIKLLEALSFGKATVSTTIGVQGLEDWAAGAVEVTDVAAEFAAAIVHLLADKTARTQLAVAGRAMAEAHLGANAEPPRAFVQAVLGDTA